MKAIIPLSRHFSTARQLQALVSSIPKPGIEDLCNQILDENPDLKTLKKLHSKILVDQHLHSNRSLGIKLMRAYAACGEPRVTRRIFNEIPNKERNIVFFNVMIRSYVNNHLCQDALLVYGRMSSHGFNPDHYTYPCVLKACSTSNNFRAGLQIHATVLRVGLDSSNLFIGNGLVAMYGKCGCLVEARKVLDEMPKQDVFSWKSMVSGYAQNARFNEALEVCKEMELSRVEPDAGTMASLLPAVTSTSAHNVSYAKDMFMKLAKKNLVSYNVMIAVHVNNSMPTEAVLLFSEMEACGMNPDAVTIASVHLFRLCC